MLDISIIKCLSDNYSYLIRDKKTNLVGVIDPSEFHPIDLEIKNNYKKLDFILNTHHHSDHVGGNIKLKEKYNSKIVGSKIDKNRIPKIDIVLSGGDSFKFGILDFEAISVPGHTNGHICFYCKDEKIVFTGDTLFSLGCGRIFEGNHKQMFSSINMIKNLPNKTKIYCGHEYTKKNLEFCLKYDSNNHYLNNKENWLKDRFKKKLPSIPTTIEEELNTNIFLRCDKSSIKKTLNMEGSSEEEVFKKLRDLKDGF